MGRKGKEGRPVISLQIVRGLEELRIEADTGIQPWPWSTARVAADEWLSAWINYYARRE